MNDTQTTERQYKNVNVRFDDELYAKIEKVGRGLGLVNPNGKVNMSQTVRVIVSWGIEPDIHGLD